MMLVYNLKHCFFQKIVLISFRDKKLVYRLLCEALWEWNGMEWNLTVWCLVLGLNQKRCDRQNSSLFWVNTLTAF